MSDNFENPWKSNQIIQKFNIMLVLVDIGISELVCITNGILREIANGRGVNNYRNTMSLEDKLMTIMILIFYLWSHQMFSAEKTRRLTSNDTTKSSLSLSFF
jgi:hypothetical protein